MRKINPGRKEKETEWSMWDGEDLTLGVYFHTHLLVHGSVVINRIFTSLSFWRGYFTINVIRIIDTTKETDGLETFLCC